MFERLLYAIYKFGMHEFSIDEIYLEFMKIFSNSLLTLSSSTSLAPSFCPSISNVPSALSPSSPLFGKTIILKYQMQQLEIGGGVYGIKLVVFLLYSSVSTMQNSIWLVIPVSCVGWCYYYVGFYVDNTFSIFNLQRLCNRTFISIVFIFLSNASRVE